MENKQKNIVFNYPKNTGYDMAAFLRMAWHFQILVNSIPYNQLPA